MVKEIKKLIGKKVVKVEKADADAGFVLIFDDGSILDVGFNSFEGSVFLNGKKLDE